MILTSSMGAVDFSVTLDLGSGDDFWCSGDLVFVNDYDSDLVHRR